MPGTIDFSNSTALRKFRRRLLNWYLANQRQLPWRANRNPYRIWVSEIMLQQTRVAAVLDHYRKFLKRFPTVRHLAAANEADVLAAWSGLGYYRRARMMHRAAGEIVTGQNGTFPKSAAELCQLPGIGRYTANAIASIAYGEPVAVVDGNVERVLTRLLGRRISARKLWDHAQSLLDRNYPGNFNQAMMELGATVCVPGKPHCGKCPLRAWCAARGQRQGERNIKVVRTRRSASLLLALRRTAVLMSRRSSDDRLMPSMWELPPLNPQPAEPPLLTVKHSITTTDWTARIFKKFQADAIAGTRWVPMRQLPHLPVTGLTRKILRKLEVLS